MKPWVTICPTAETTDHLTLIKGWYNDSPTDTNSISLGECGNLVFDTNVNIIQIPYGVASHQIDVSNMLPYECAFNIVYWYHPHYEVLEVFGTVSYDTLVIHRAGLITPDILQPTKYGNAPYPMTTDMEVEDLQHHFYLPWMPSLQKLQDASVNYGDFERRIQWLIRYDQTGVLEVDDLDFDLDDRVVGFLCVLLIEYMERYKYVSPHVNRLHMQYEELRYEAESKLFNARMSRADLREAHVTDLLYFNGLEDWMEENRVCDPPAADHQSFYRRWPAAMDSPSIFFAVPMELISNLDHLHVYHGGLVHIGYKDIGNWAWNRYMQAVHTLLVYHPFDPTRDEKLESYLRAQTKCIVHYLNEPKIKRARKPDYLPMQRPASKYPRSNVSVPEIEDLWKIMPPCHAQLREHQRYFKYEERKRLTQNMYLAGVSMESIVKFHEVRHNAFPKHGSLNSRFNPAKYMKDMLEKKPDELNLSHSCRNIISETLDKPHSDVIRCPFVDPRKTAEQNLPLCKQACNNYGKDPAWIMRRNLRFVETHKVKEDAEKVDEMANQGGGENEESSSSSEEEEESIFANT
jgi:hypothetical protein